MTTLTETVHPNESLVSEAPGDRSRESIVVSSGNVVKACQVLGAVETGVPAVTAGSPVSGAGGTVGNGTVGAWTGDAGIMAGKWNLEITAEAANAGTFKVVRPDGTVSGVGTVAVAYNGELNGTLADGSNDWKVGDVIPITVEYLDGDSAKKYEPLDPAASDGSQNAAAIAYGDYDGTSADVRGVAYLRDCEHNADIVLWPSGITADQKQRAVNQLAALGISLR